MGDTKDVVTVERFIPAPAEEIFDLLARPDRHKDIDGSGTVVAAKEEARKVGLGDQFGMSMKIGLPYSMVSTVVEYEEGRRIAWQTTGPTKVGRHVGGRIWRYELEPQDGGTLVKESWDIRKESPFTKPVVRLSAKKTGENMAKTLENIEQLVAS